MIEKLVRLCQIITFTKWAIFQRKLFCIHTFRNRTEQVPPKYLTDIAHHIVKKSCGLPLAIKTIARFDIAYQNREDVISCRRSNWNILLKQSKQFLDHQWWVEYFSYKHHISHIISAHNPQATARILKFSIDMNHHMKHLRDRRVRFILTGNVAEICCSLKWDEAIYSCHIPCYCFDGQASLHRSATKQWGTIIWSTLVWKEQNAWMQNNFI